MLDVKVTKEVETTAQEITKEYKMITEITRPIMRRERFVEIVKSMPRPTLEVNLEFAKGSMKILTAVAINEGGNCKYIYGYVFHSSVVEEMSFWETLNEEI